MSSRLSASARRQQLLDVALDDVRPQRLPRDVDERHRRRRRGDQAGPLPALRVQARAVPGAPRRRRRADGRRHHGGDRRGVTSGREQTERGFAAYFRWVAENRDAFVLLYGGASRQDQEFSAAVRKVTAEAATAIAPLIDAGIDPEHQLTLAHAIVGLSEGPAAGSSSAAASSIPTRSPASSAPSPGPGCAASTSRCHALRLDWRNSAGSGFLERVRSARRVARQTAVPVGTGSRSPQMSPR